jgi:hypothetical protein
MKDIFDAFEKGQNEFLNSLNDATAWGPSESFTALQAQGDRALQSCRADGARPFQAL